MAYIVDFSVLVTKLSIADVFTFSIPRYWSNLGDNPLIAVKQWVKLQKKKSGGDNEIFLAY